MCEQGSSSSFVNTDSDNKPTTRDLEESKHPILIKQLIVTPEKKNRITKSLARPLQLTKKSESLQPKLDTNRIKSKPKRMGSERPEKKSNKKLRKVSMIKNSLSLRLKPNQQENTNKSSKPQSRFSESENELFTNRDYSEEQGRKALNFNTSNCKSNSALSKSESRQVDATKSTNSSMKYSNAKTVTNGFRDTKGCHISTPSCDSSWNNDTKTVFNTVKPKKYKKLSNEEKLE